VDAIVAAVRRSLRRERMIPEGARVLTAVSGGSDSVALLSLLLELGHQVVAAHFNHGWRGAESDRDEAFVRDLCRQLGVPLAVGRADSAPSSALEATGRRLRYAYLHQAALEHRCQRIATGHTRDDQAETVLLRLLRGSGLGGLRAIHAVRSDGVVRPLLEIGREDLRAYLARRGLSFVEDTSNSDRRFSRNRLRAEVMPALRRFSPRADQRLADLAAALAGRAERDHLLAEELLRRGLDAEGGLSAAVLAELPRQVRVLVARAWLAAGAGGLQGLNAVHLRAVATCSRSGARVELPNGLAVVNEHGFIRLIRSTSASLPAEALLEESGAVVFDGRWRIASSGAQDRAAVVEPPADLWQAVFDAEQVSPPFLVRAWIHGDRVQPLGLTGRRKLSDVFIDAKIARRERQRLPVIEASGRILWVPGIVRSAHATVSQATRRILRLTAQALSTSSAD
jgi:tRNA(Ile)-lysidine synthase